MRFWRHKKVRPQILTQQKPSKADVLTGLKLCCSYLERNIQNNPGFESEFETAKKINTVLEDNQILTEEQVKYIVKLMSEIDKIKHYDGSGWLDYKIRLSHFFRLSGFDIKLF